MIRRLDAWWRRPRSPGPFGPSGARPPNSPPIPRTSKPPSAAPPRPGVPTMWLLDGPAGPDPNMAELMAIVADLAAVRCCADSGENDQTGVCPLCLADSALTPDRHHSACPYRRARELMGRPEPATGG